MKQWLSTKEDVEGMEGNKRYTLSKVGHAAARNLLQYVRQQRRICRYPLTDSLEPKRSMRISAG